MGASEWGVGEFACMKEAQRRDSEVGVEEEASGARHRGERTKREGVMER